MPFPGLGLLYYGQGYLIYPSAFPPGSRTGVFAGLLYIYWTYSIATMTSTYHVSPYPRFCLLVHTDTNWDNALRTLNDRCAFTRTVWYAIRGPHA